MNSTADRTVRNAFWSFGRLYCSQIAQAQNAPCYYAVQLVLSLCFRAEQQSALVEIVDMYICP